MTFKKNHKIKKKKQLKLEASMTFHSPELGVGFCPLLNALPDVSMKTSERENVFIFNVSAFESKVKVLPLTWVTHLITTPSIADFKYKSTEHSAFSWSSRAVVMHFSTPTGIGNIVLPETWPCTLKAKVKLFTKSWDSRKKNWFNLLGRLCFSSCESV